MDSGDVNAMQIRLLTVKMRECIIRETRSLIKRLTDRQILKDVPVQMSEVELNNICYLLPDILINEPTCLELDLNNNSSLIVVGDIFGQYGHLFRLFEHFGFPPEKRYLFLGNYAANNNANRGLEVLALLFAYKLKYPRSIYLLRGKHECKNIARTHGLYDKCLKRFTRRLWSSIVNVFTYLPPVAIIQDRILCVHSGLSPNLFINQITDLNKLKDYFHTFISRPTEIDPNNLVSHLIWSDPDPDTKLWDQNPIGMGYLYGLDVAKKLTNDLDLALIIRSSELIPKGFEYFQEHRLLTIFSAPDYQESYGNNGSIVQLSKISKDQHIRMKIHVLKPIIKLRSKATLKMNITIDEISYII